MTKTPMIRRFGAQSGSALYATLVTSVAMVGMSIAMAKTSLSTKAEYDGAQKGLERYYAAEAGIAHALSELKAGRSGVLGSKSSPVKIGAASYWVSTVARGDGSRLFDLVSTGKAGGHGRTVEGVVREDVPGVFHHAMFAGNSSGDPNYSLDLGGTGSSADSVDGDVYCERDITISGDADVTGTISAGGTITGANGLEGVSQTLPDLAAMNYDTTADVDVAAEFAAHESYETASSYGGDAWEVQHGNAAHIFRKNPSDRESEWSATAKEDYFLEDTYESMDTSDSSVDGSGTVVSLAASQAEAVYYVDGNLWVHNKNIYTFRLRATDNGHHTKVTFAVKGNVYFSDNVILDDATNDGIAFIALKDTDVADSGNIYFGDSLFGTLERMDAYMYAENDFVDRNLSGGSVEVNGLMSAGNHVKISRDNGDRHTRLDLDFDPRVRDGDIDIPGLPHREANATSGSTFTLVWSMEVGRGRGKNK